MLDSFEIVGIWWIPGRDNTKLPGTLKYTNLEGGNLEVMGFLSELPEHHGPIRFPSAIDIILGLSSKGERVTLYNNFSYGVGFKSEIETSHFVTGYVFVGAHFSNESEAQFRTLTIQYTHVNEWANISGIIGPKDNLSTISYRELEPIIFKRDPFLIKIQPWAQKSFSRSDREYRLKELVLVKIEANVITSFLDLIRIAYGIKTFLCFAIQKPSYFTEISGESDKADIIVPSRKARVQVYFPQGETKSVKTSRMPLLFLSDLENRPDIFSKWFEKLDEIEKVLLLFFGVLFTPDMPKEDIFLKYVQAIEGYHRIKNRIENSTIEEHYWKVSLLLHELKCRYNRRLREWVEYNLKFAYEPILVDRLRSILRSTSEALLNIVFSEKPDSINKDEIEKKREKAIKEIVILRNNLTHPDSEPEVTDLKITGAIDIIRFLLVIIIMDEIGIDRNLIEERLERANM